MTSSTFRQIALGMQGASEGAHMGHADFRVGGRIFASLTADERSATVKLLPDQQQRFINTSSSSFTPASGAWGRQGWTTIHLADADEELVGEAVTLAWQGVAATPPAAATRSAARRPARTAARATKHPAVDAYIAASPAAVQPILEKIRAIVRKEAPRAAETISYRMPAFTLDGAFLYYAPFKAHIGIYPPVKGDAALSAALAPYRGPKGNLRFPLDEPMPYPLIRRLVKARLAEHRARLARKRR